MENIIQDVATPAEATADPKASTGEIKPEVIEAPASVHNEETEKLAKIAEEALDRIERADLRILKLKKILQEKGIEEDEIEGGGINERLARLEELVTKAISQKEETSIETATLRKRLSETTESLKSKNSISNSGMGANQSKLGRDQQLPALNQKD